MTKIKISTTGKYDLIDITDDVIDAIDIKNGLVTVFAKHTTAGILITENEVNLKKDWIKFFKESFDGKQFNHDKLDGNGGSHLLGGLVGSSETLIVEDGIVLGNWQRIFLVDFDGPRTRELVIKTIKDD